MVPAESEPPGIFELSQVGVCGGSVVSGKKRTLLFEAGHVSGSVLALVTGAQRENLHRAKPITASSLCGEAHWTVRKGIVLTVVQTAFAALLFEHSYVVLQ
jgi:hypothetical protein